jgi:transposase InsO family protein
LNVNLFYSIDHAGELASEWMHEYNYERPHAAPGEKRQLSLNDGEHHNLKQTDWLKHLQMLG